MTSSFPLNVAMDLLVTSVSDGVTSARVDLPESARNVAVVGFLMAMRDELECVTDEDILAGCHMLESESKVMQKFIVSLSEPMSVFPVCLLYCSQDRRSVVFAMWFLAHEIWT